MDRKPNYTGLLALAIIVLIIVIATASKLGGRLFSGSKGEPQASPTPIARTTPRATATPIVIQQPPPSNTYNTESINMNSGTMNSNMAPGGNINSNAAPDPEDSVTGGLGVRFRQAERIILRGEALTLNDLEGLSPTNLRVLRNTIFARHGRGFNSTNLQRYFDEKTWYQYNPNYSDTDLTYIDRENIDVLRRAEGN